MNIGLYCELLGFKWKRRFQRDGRGPLRNGRAKGGTGRPNQFFNSTKGFRWSRKKQEKSGLNSLDSSGPLRYSPFTLRPVRWNLPM